VTIGWNEGQGQRKKKTHFNSSLSKASDRSTHSHKWDHQGAHLPYGPTCLQCFEFHWARKCSSKAHTRWVRTLDWGMVSAWDHMPERKLAWASITIHLMSSKLAASTLPKGWCNFNPWQHQMLRIEHWKLVFECRLSRGLWSDCWVSRSTRALAAISWSHLTHCSLTIHCTLTFSSASAVFWPTKDDAFFQHPWPPAPVMEVVSRLQRLHPATCKSYLLSLSAFVHLFSLGNGVWYLSATLFCGQQCEPHEWSCNVPQMLGWWARQPSLV